jgi:hypothetical protein
MAKKKSAKVLTKLTEAEQDLVSHVEHGWEFAIDLGSAYERVDRG